jgi:hypothetical protein
MLAQEQACKPLLLAALQLLQQQHHFTSQTQTETLTHIHGTKEPRLLIHGQRLLRTNERQPGNCFLSLGSRSAGQGQDPPTMLLRFLQLQSRVRA